MAEINYLTELLRFAATAVLRGFTFLFFSLIYQVLSAEIYFEKLLFNLSVWVFVCSACVPNITNFNVLNNSRVDSLDSRVAGVLTLLTSLFGAIFDPSYLLVTVFLLALLSVNGEATILRSGRILTSLFSWRYVM